MAMSSLKAAFCVRKSNRLNIKSKFRKSTGDKSENGNSKTSPDKTSPTGIKSPKCRIAVTGLQKEPGTIDNPVYRGDDSSLSSISPPPNLCQTPPHDESLSLSFSSEARKAFRDLLSSPSSTGSGKRKSDEENDSEAHSSPIKSPRKTPKSTKKEVVTPKSSRRSSLFGARTGNSTPRRLFADSENTSSTPSKDNTSTPSRAFANLKLMSPGQPIKLQRPDAKPYQTAKHALHTAKPERLIGREKEEEELEEFITDKIDKKISSSIYISGPPGTGKTAVVSHVVDRLKCHYSRLQTATINCMMLRDSNTVFTHLYKELTNIPLERKDGPVKAMEKLITSSKNSILLVLDEIDQLDSKHHEILYRIFEWPALRGSKVILIGIANALDLTDRMLPRLQAAVKYQPVLMNFAPYTSTQITDILKTRLDRDRVVEPSAILFCAKKVASVAGDVRKALDVCRRAVEIVEADARTQQVLKPSDCNSPSKKNQPPPLKTVNITHISKVMSNIYGSSVSSAATGENDMPLHQKLAICSLLVLVKSGKFKEVTLGKLYDAYVKVCKRQQTATVDQSEFHSILGLLEARGVTALKKAKDTRSIKVSLKLDEQELEQTLRDKRLMDAILKAGLS